MLERCTHHNGTALVEEHLHCIVGRRRNWDTEIEADIHHCMVLVATDQDHRRVRGTVLYE